MGALTAKIESEIRNHGAITFARFMELALYCPVYGYYEKEGDIIGRGGDYYTSVSVGDLLGKMLAHQFAQWFAAADAPNLDCELIETGAHQGDLARDILHWLRAHRPEVFGRLQYSIVEPSPTRRRWQEKTLAHFGAKIRWAQNLRELAAASQRVRIIFANELLDAMPVHRLGWDAKNHTWFEWGVALHQGSFAWKKCEPTAFGPSDRSDSREAFTSLMRMWREIQSGSDAAAPDSIAVLLEALPDGFTVDVSPAAERWWLEAARSLRQGKLLTLDYGWTGEGLLTPQHAHGTARAYRKHRVQEDILASPGEQDITADVNFTGLIRVGESAGLKTELFATQERFLTDIAAQIWNDPSSFGAWTPEYTRQFKTLTHPEHLGRAFKVLVQCRRLTQ